MSSNEQVRQGQQGGSPDVKDSDKKGQQQQSHQLPGEKSKDAAADHREKNESNKAV